MIDTSGENVRTVLTAAADETFGKIQWSVDGKRIAVLVNRINNPLSSIDAVDLATGRRKQLTTLNYLRTFAWLADGRMVLAAQDPSSASSALLYISDPDGGRHALPVGAGMKVADMSATADGQRLVVVRANEQSDVYAGSIERNNSLSDPRRITLDDRDDRPSGWLRDANTMLFESARNGTLDVFRERLDSPVAELLAGGPDQQYGARITPDGVSVLYWSGADSSPDKRLMTIPAGGGPTNVLLSAPRTSQFYCSSACVLATFENGKVSLSSLDWKTGARQPLPDSGVPKPADPVLWALSPDATQTAWVTEKGVQVMGRYSWDVTSTSVEGRITGIAFSHEPDTLAVTTTSARENLAWMLRRAGAQKIWSSPRQLCCPVPSPDGRKLLLGVNTVSSNAWLVENF